MVSASAASTCWAMPGSIYTINTERLLRVLQKTRPRLQTRTPDHCNAPLEPSDLDSLHQHPLTHARAAGQKAKQRKILSLPKRHSRRGQLDALPPSASVRAFCLTPCKVLVLPRRALGGSRIFLEEFLITGLLNKHACVLWVFECSTTLGTRPTLSFHRQREENSHPPTQASLLGVS